MTKKLVFLLGSGVSRAAKMPSMGDITEAVLKGVVDGHKYKRLTDGRYSSANVPDLSPGYMVSVLAFLRELREQCSAYFARDVNYDVNYEDIAYLAWQVREEQSGNYENPALAPLVRALRRKLHEPITSGDRDSNVGSLAREAYMYIHCLVREMLVKPPISVGHMQCLLDACRHSDFSRVHIFTLNHDILIEQELRAGQVDFSDGFELQSETCDYWSPETFARSRKRVRLAKLHGSVDWYLYKPDRDNPVRQLIGRPRAAWDDVRDLAGGPQTPIHDESIMLIGSFNKILEYSGGIFSDLYCFFRESLRSTSHLVVSGYGFRDKAVNHSVVEWLRGRRDRKLIIIHEDYQAVGREGRKAIRDLFSTNSAQIEGTGKWFEHSSLADLQRRF